jgi:hypothetical protein
MFSPVNNVFNYLYSDSWYIFRVYVCMCSNEKYVLVEKTLNIFEVLFFHRKLRIPTIL